MKVWLKKQRIALVFVWKPFRIQFFVCFLVRHMDLEHIILNILKIVGTDCSKEV